MTHEVARFYRPPTPNSGGEKSSSPESWGSRGLKRPISAQIFLTLTGLKILARQAWANAPISTPGVSLQTGCTRSQVSVNRFAKTAQAFPHYINQHWRGKDAWE